MDVRVCITGPEHMRAFAEDDEVQQKFKYAARNMPFTLTCHGMETVNFTI